MRSWGFLLLIFILALPLAYPLSVRELIASYTFSASTPEMNLTNHADSMIDKNGNGVSDTLVIDLTTKNKAGNFIFAVSLLDKNGIITNETNFTLNAGINKLNITFNTFLLSQNQLNYSVKIYNSSYSLKYRKDNILTQFYPNYETGFEILDVQNSGDGKNLIVNITINSTINGTFPATLFLSYNDSTISSKSNYTLTDSAQDLIFGFDNETIKRTHYVGTFNIQSLKIGNKIIRLSQATNRYDFRDFAASSYIDYFDDNGIDANHNSKYDSLQITANAQIFQDDYYTMELGLYDMFGNLVGANTQTFFLDSGNHQIPISFNGSKIYSKKLDGPFVVKYAKLLRGNTSIDEINNAHITKNYNFNDFESQSLPDLIANIAVSGEYHYGANNATVNITFKNIGNKHAFNVFTEIFDNNTLTKINRSNLLMANAEIPYQINLTNFSDFEIIAAIDFDNLVEESDENNNAQRFVVKLNKKPILAPIGNIIAKESDTIILNLSAADLDNDALVFSINSSKFSKSDNIFAWNTTANDSGYYEFMAAVSDGFLNDSVIFDIVVLDIVENDLDKDGIDDSIDSLIGDGSFVNTSTISLTVAVDNSTDLFLFFNKSYHVKFLDKNLTVLEFNFDFSRYRLNLSKITINKQQTNESGSLLVKGLEMPQYTTKTAYVDRLDNKSKEVCIKDIQLSDISVISKKCNLKNEIKLECNSKPRNGYSCIYNPGLHKYRVNGLKHSGIIEISSNEPNKDKPNNEHIPKMNLIKRMFSIIFK